MSAIEFSIAAEKSHAPLVQRAAAVSGFRAGLAGVSAATRADAGKARRFADGKLTRLAEAERQRQAVEDRAKLQAEAIARGLELPALGGRKAIGTALE